MIELFDLFIVFILVCAIALLWHNAGFKERALGAAKAHCDKYDVQLLDESMVIKGLWPQRSQRGYMVMRRRYEFEFTATGNQRYIGEVTMVGHKLAGVQLAPHQIDA
jgi:Protein of unknown function (DUF3301)